jgi:cell division protein FtsL
VSGPATAPKRARATKRVPLGARLLDALLSGRVWIGLVGVLLAGIVFFNVDLMRMNREITHVADRAADVKRQNASLRQDVAQLANSERIQEAAAELGLVLPQPDQVRYLKSNPRIDARTASKRIIAPNPAAAPDPVVAQPETPIAPTTPTTTGTTTTTLPPTTTSSPTSATAASPTG